MKFLEKEFQRNYDLKLINIYIQILEEEIITDSLKPILVFYLQKCFLIAIDNTDSFDSIIKPNKYINNLSNILNYILNIVKNNKLNNKLYSINSFILIKQDIVNLIGMCCNRTLLLDLEESTKNNAIDLLTSDFINLKEDIIVNKNTIIKLLNNYNDISNCNLSISNINNKLIINEKNCNKSAVLVKNSSINNKSGIFDLTDNYKSNNYKTLNYKNSKSILNKLENSLNSLCKFLFKFAIDTSVGKIIFIKLFNKLSTKDKSNFCQLDKLNTQEDEIFGIDSIEIILKYVLNYIVKELLNDNNNINYNNNFIAQANIQLEKIFENMISIDNNYMNIKTFLHNNNNEIKKKYLINNYNSASSINFSDKTIQTVNSFTVIMLSVNNLLGYMYESKVSCNLIMKLLYYLNIINS